MIPDKRFIQLPKSFWALVRLIGQECGYASDGKITIPAKADVQAALVQLELDQESLDAKLPDGRPV